MSINARCFFKTHGDQKGRICEVTKQGERELTHDTGTPQSQRERETLS